MLTHGHHVEIHTTTANGSAPELPAAIQQPVPVGSLSAYYHPLSIFPPARRHFVSPSLRMAIRSRLSCHDVCTIHGTFTYIDIACSTECTRARIPYFVFTHGAFEPWALEHKHRKKAAYLSVAERIVYRRASGIFVCNSAEHRWFAEHGLGNRTHILQWGFDAIDTESPLSASEFASRYPQLNQQPYVLFMARIHPKKGLDLLLRSFALLADRFPGWTLVVAGSGDANSEASVRKEASTLGIADRVLFTGFVNGRLKESLLGNAALFVLPSHSEGFPVAVVEALAHGVPSVLTRACYVPEVAAQRAGLEVDPDVRSLTEALQALMSSPALLGEAAKNAKKLAESRWSWSAVGEEFLATVRRAIAIR